MDGAYPFYDSSDSDSSDAEQEPYEDKNGIAYDEHGGPDIAKGVFLPSIFLREMKRAMSPDSFKYIEIQILRGRHENKPWEQVLQSVGVLFIGQPELHDKFSAFLRSALPGTTLYCYTRPDSTLLFRPNFTINDLALEWKIDHPQFDTSRFSKDCAICQDPFEDEIRTLKACKHSFCSSCITPHAASYASRNTDPTSRIRFPCPVCRSDNVMFLPLEEWEIMHNDLLVLLQNETRHYKCAFAEHGCTTTDIKRKIHDHMSSCAFRKYRCDLGCKHSFSLDEMHHSHTDCIKFLEDVISKKDALVTEKTFLLQEKDAEIDRLRDKVMLLEDRGLDGGRRKRRATQDA